MGSVDVPQGVFHELMKAGDATPKGSTKGSRG